MPRRRIAVVDAPSNLGLRPPEEGSVPGCYKAPGALRDRRIVERLGARDAGVVVPPRYRAEWWPGYGVRNGEAIAHYSGRLAARIGEVLDSGDLPVVLGGDCSILVGAAVALADRGRYGLVFVDGHSDFRHAGNAEAVGAAAGEDLAIVTGRGGDLGRLGGHDRYFADADVVVAGIRPDDEYLEELRALGVRVHLAPEMRGRAGEVAAGAVAHMEERGVEGYWIHLDVDVLDAAVMPAVDSPDPDGLERPDLRELLEPLLASPLAAGMEVTVFDPDLDAGGSLAAALADDLVAAFAARVA
ncbi:MAG TPA: arginase family protein [Actinomycetota bacterium]|nr:arginase family protein [Actinomycetota bacterium]